jgi:hypothetical protein
MQSCYLNYLLKIYTFGLRSWLELFLFISVVDWRKLKELKLHFEAIFHSHYLKDEAFVALMLAALNLEGLHLDGWEKSGLVPLFCVLFKPGT